MLIAALLIGGYGIVAIVRLSWTGPGVGCVAFATPLAVFGVVALVRGHRDRIDTDRAAAEDLARERHG